MSSKRNNTHRQLENKMSGLNYNFSKNNNNQTTKNNNTDLNTNDLDTLISKIAQLKAAPQSASRDAELQTLIASRNALATTIWGK